MKKNQEDPRHLRRIRAVKSLFAYSFNKLAKRESTLPVSGLSKKTLAKLKKINQVISRAAPKWPLEKINRIDLAILRLATWELLYRPKVPPKVVINEAIELAKEFGGEASPSFVNGVLGTVFKKFIEKKGKKKKKDEKQKSVGKDTQG